MPPIIPIPSTTTPSIAHPSAVAALLLRATLTDDGHCCICELWLVWYPLPLGLEKWKNDTKTNGLWGEFDRQNFLVVRTMSKRSIKILSTDDERTTLVTGRDWYHSPKIEFSPKEPQSYIHERSRVVFILVSSAGFVADRTT